LVYLFIKAAQKPEQATANLLHIALKELGLPEMDRLHDPSGRPYLPSGPQISVSHSRNYAAVALGDGPIGVDLEESRTLRPRLIRRVLSEPEYQWYLNRGSDEEDFLTLWTLKESWYKYQGTGLPGFPNETAFYQDGDRWHLSGASQSFFVLKKDLLHAALCSDGQEVTVRILRES